jgi:pentose-5-phosphate-3-epimerase
MALRPMTRVFFDVHLMCSRPDILLEPFARAGADQITVHAELGDRVGHLLWQIKALGCRVGLAINPPTTMGHLEPYLSLIDLLLVMTVNPGLVASLSSPRRCRRSSKPEPGGMRGSSPIASPWMVVSRWPPRPSALELARTRS